MSRRAAAAELFIFILRGPIDILLSSSKQVDSNKKVFFFIDRNQGATMGILNGDIPLNALRVNDDNLPTDTSIEQVNDKRVVSTNKTYS